MEKQEKKEKQNNIQQKPTWKDKFNFIINQAKKVRWANWKEVKKSTLIVCSLTIIVITYFALIDYAYSFVKDLF